MTTASDLFGPTLILAIEHDAPEVIFIGNSVPSFKFEDELHALPDAEPIALKDLRIALNTIGGVDLGFESMHKGWFNNDGHKFDLEIFHEPERTGASFKRVKELDAPAVEATDTPVNLPSSILGL